MFVDEYEFCYPCYLTVPEVEVASEHGPGGLDKTIGEIERRSHRHESRGEQRI